MCSIRNAFYVFLHENINHMVDNFWNMIFVRGIYIVLSWFDNVITMQDRVKHSQRGPFCSHSSIVSKQILKIVLHHAYYICFSTFVWEKNCKLFSNQHLFLLSPTIFVVVEIIQNVHISSDVFYCFSLSQSWNFVIDYWFSLLM